VHHWKVWLWGRSSSLLSYSFFLQAILSSCVLRYSLTVVNAPFFTLSNRIAGDTAPNVLWRLMHGEMPDYFSPKVWWLVLGSNDLGRMLVGAPFQRIIFCLQ